MYKQLDQKIQDILASTNKMVLSTSVGGNASAASVFYALDGTDLLFFTFNPSRKAEQIKYNPRVQAVIWPKGEQGIKGLQVSGECYQIKEKQEKQKAYDLILKSTTAFQSFMDDKFLNANNVVGYYRIKPTSIKYVDFYAQEKFEWKTFPGNKTNPLLFSLQMVLKQISLLLRTTRAPFLSATFASIFIGAALAWNDLKTLGFQESWSWQLFFFILLGASLAQIATNTSNDYFDHTSNADEVNKVPSPFNGGSRVIQSGLQSPGKVLFISLFCSIATVLSGLFINHQISGQILGNTPVLWFGIMGLFLTFAYTADPFRLGYKGFGELSIAIGFGPLMVMGAHYVLTAPIHNNVLTVWNWQESLLASAPIAILVMLIVWINQFQDAPYDAAVGKNTWVVRTATNKEWLRLEKPLVIYKWFMIIAFVGITLIGILGIFTPLGTAFAFLALAPLLLVRKAFKMADDWLHKWNNPDADRQKVPYKLLAVNVSTIGIHFLTGILLAVAYLF